MTFSFVANHVVWDARDVCPLILRAAMPEMLIHEFFNSHAAKPMGILGFHGKYTPRWNIRLCHFKRHFLGVIILVEPLFINLGRPVRPVDNLEKLKTKRKPYWGGKSPGAIAISFVPSRGLTTKSVLQNPISNGQRVSNRQIHEICLLGNDLSPQKRPSSIKHCIALLSVHTLTWRLVTSYKFAVAFQSLVWEVLVILKTLSMHRVFLVIM